jgi:thiamine-monophosphate kinase
MKIEPSAVESRKPERTGGNPLPAASTPDGTPTETIGTLGEFGLIDRVTTDRVQPASTLLGPGDDAAVVAAPDGRVVASTDVLVEGVHFRFDWTGPEQVGRRAAAANLADIAAMGAVPTALLIGLGCPEGTPVPTLTALADGLWAEAASVGAGVVGGDVTSASGLMISVTALGSLQGREPVRRSGARPGDVLALCGRVGWAAAGWAVLARGFRSPAVAVNAYRVPQPPYAAGPQAAAAGATAMIDVSDGLLADLGHVATASGVLIDVHSAALAVPPRLADVGAALGVDPKHWLLTGGEDHALAATFPGPPPEGWTVIGTVAAGEPGVVVDGRPYTAGPPGWTHFTR